MSEHAPPVSYREIAKRAGVEATLRLAKARGGQRIYVPKDPRVAPWLVQTMGETGAAALIAMYGGEAIDLPHQVTIEAEEVPSPAAPGTLDPSG